MCAYIHIRVHYITQVYTYGHMMSDASISGLGVRILPNRISHNQPIARSSERQANALPPRGRAVQARQKATIPQSRKTANIL